MPGVQEGRTPEEHPETGTPENARILFDVLQRQEGTDLIDRANRVAMVEIYKANPPPPQNRDNGFFLQELLSCQRVPLPNNGDLKRYFEEKNIFPYRLTVDIAFSQTNLQALTDDELTDELFAVFETLWPLTDHCLFGLHPRISPILSHSQYNKVRLKLNKAFAKAQGYRHLTGTLVEDRDGVWGWGKKWDFVIFTHSESSYGVVERASYESRALPPLGWFLMAGSIPYDPQGPSQ
jgi:hypothetical protein